MTMTEKHVHNHGPEEGKGLACRELRINGQLVGECVLRDKDFRPEAPEPDTPPPQRDLHGKHCPTCDKPRHVGDSCPDIYHLIDYWECDCGYRTTDAQQLTHECPNPASDTPPESDDEQQAFDVAESRRICEAATPGPWLHFSAKRINEVHVDAKHVIAGWPGFDDKDNAKANAKFIAHARTALPAACARIEQLEAEVARLSSHLTERQEELSHYDRRLRVGVPGSRTDQIPQPPRRSRPGGRMTVRDEKRCRCGVEIFMCDVFSYNAHYSREFPANAPLRHACDSPSVSPRMLEIGRLVIELEKAAWSAGIREEGPDDLALNERAALLAAIASLEQNARPAPADTPDIEALLREFQQESQAFIGGGDAAPVLKSRAALLSAITQLRERAESAEAQREDALGGQKLLGQQLNAMCDHNDEVEAEIESLRTQLSEARTIVEPARRFIATGGFVANGGAQIKAHNDLRIACLAAPPDRRESE